MQNIIKIHDKDNVAVALETLSKGQILRLDAKVITVAQEIPIGHKLALNEIEYEEDILKYGYSIGKATQPIHIGEWVHTHNIRTSLGDLLEYKYLPITSANPKIKIETSSEDDTKNETPQYFDGFRREEGLVGIRNEIYIVPTVGCVNSIARLLAKKGMELITDKIDSIIAFEHPYGCSQLGEDQTNTQKILAGIIRHPNAAGVLVLGLGCENNNVEEMKKHLGTISENRVKFLVCQEVEDEMEQGIALIKELVDYASCFEREKVPVSELIIGLKCGGSDGLSGITANPLVGAFSDLLIAKGGTTILTEVPEMFGAETILMNRCIERSVYDQTVLLINEYKKYYIEHNQPIYENPSPGNKKGGISTLEDKSLGCTQKSGDSKVVGVLRYGERVDRKGLELLSAPGNDLVASTALAAAGAQIILFTTGRGTPIGVPVPTIKISSNSELAQKKGNWIDFDAGRLIREEKGEDLTKELYQLVLEVASGRKVKSEECGYHDLAIWKQGVTL